MFTITDYSQCSQIKIQISTRPQSLYSKDRVKFNKQRYIVNTLCVTAKAEIGVIQLQGKGCLGLLTTPWDRSSKKHPPLEPLGFSGGSAGKESACNAGDLGSIPGSGRFPGEGKGYPVQYSGLKNSIDCIVPGVTKSLDTTERLSLRAFRDSMLCWHLDFAFWPPELWEETFLTFYAKKKIISYLHTQRRTHLRTVGAGREHHL